MVNRNNRPGGAGIPDVFSFFLSLIIVNECTYLRPVLKFPTYADIDVQLYFVLGNEDTSS
jgi:hypothetical protein